MIVARVIQGLAGGMLPVAFGIIRDEFPAEKVAGAVGVLAALTAVGAGLGSCWRARSCRRWTSASSDQVRTDVQPYAGARSRT